MKRLYIFSGDKYLVRDSLKKLKDALDIPYETLNVTEYKTSPKTDELMAACAEYPFMAENRLLIVRDCPLLGTAGSAEEAKKLAAYLDKMPDTTVLVLCSEGAPDKRRSLYKRICELGEVREFAAPTAAACTDFVMAEAKAQGAKIAARPAAELVAASGCDYFTLENEIAKLAVYSDFGEITSAHVKACASRSLEYNVFEIHRLFVEKKAGQARDLLADILESESPEGLIGLFARKVRDMYKTKTMLDAGFGEERIADALNAKSFVARMLIKECGRFTAAQLRDGLKQLAELDYGIKSGQRDSELGLSAALVSVYGF
jgi:DNA polymerase-3 subunit delta